MVPAGEAGIARRSPYTSGVSRATERFETGRTWIVIPRNRSLLPSCMPAMLAMCAAFGLSRRRFLGKWILMARFGVMLG